MLTPRQQEVLYLIVDLYGNLEEPIGSKKLLKESYLKVSPATIRNDMVALENHGFLKKTHTSSGRVPSRNGYRYVINQIIHQLNNLEFDEDENGDMDELFSHYGRDNFELTKVASDILASETGYPVVVLGQNNESHYFEEMKLVGINDRDVIAILLTQDEKVENHIFNLPIHLTKDQSQQIIQLINDELEGLTLEDAYQRMKLNIPFAIQRVVSYQIDFSPLIQKAIFNLKSHYYHVSGRMNIFNLVDLSNNNEEIKAVFELIDGSQRMYQILENRDEGIEVLFGSELQDSNLLDICLITGTYTIHNQRITIGIIGPYTMSYKRTIRLLELMIQKLSRL